MASSAQKVRPNNSQSDNSGVSLCYDLRTMVEVRIFHDRRFLCRAICPDLAAKAVSFGDIAGGSALLLDELCETPVSARGRAQPVEAGRGSLPGWLQPACKN
jgi:hypothetical protein